MTDHCLASKCGRPLKTAESKARGYGPVCWSRINPTAPMIAAPGHVADPNQIPLPLENPVDTETRKAAIDTVARHALHQHLSYATSAGQIDWGDYPGVDEDDWESVLNRVSAIAESIAPSDEQYEAAYAHLAADSVSAKADRHPYAATVQEGQNQ